MDGGAWWTTVHGIARVGHTRLSDFTFTFHFHALEKEMAAHSSVLAWKIPWTGKLGGLPSMGSHRVGHGWSDLTARGLLVTLCSQINTKKCDCVHKRLPLVNTCPLYTYKAQESHLQLRRHLTIGVQNLKFSLSFGYPPTILGTFISCPILFWIIHKGNTGWCPFSGTEITQLIANTEVASFSKYWIPFSSPGVFVGRLSSHETLTCHLLLN